MNNNILLVGAGPMAIEYAKVLTAQGVNFSAIGRGEESAKRFQQETGVSAITGGVDQWLSINPRLPEKAIVCVNENLLGLITRKLIQSGIKRILVEKPGGLDIQDIREVATESKKYGSQVYVGYNRRFYASTQKVQELIHADGGVSSFHFEFTEWGHVIAGLEKAPGVKEEWFLANSSHVIDLAFFLGGQPKEICCFTAGGTDWHPRASVYAGAGRTEEDALFSYCANWEAPGRWSVEVMTRKHRLIFRPMEKLQVQKIGSVAIEEVPLDDDLDRRFKPGIYKQVETFLANKDKLLTIDEQVANVEYYKRINRP